jgi:hypothetical protein
MVSSDEGASIVSGNLLMPRSAAGKVQFKRSARETLGKSPSLKHKSPQEGHLRKDTARNFWVPGNSGK